MNKKMEKRNRYVSCILWQNVAKIYCDLWALLANFSGMNGHRQSLGWLYLQNPFHCIIIVCVIYQLCLVSIIVKYSKHGIKLTSHSLFWRLPHVILDWMRCKHVALITEEDHLTLHLLTSLTHGKEPWWMGKNLMQLCFLTTIKHRKPTAVMVFSIQLRSSLSGLKINWLNWA